MSFSPPASIEDVPTVDELVAVADAKVAGLKDAKRRLAWIIRRHIISGVTGAPSAMPNALILGNTGTGKTFLLKTMLEAAPVIYSDSNMTEYSDVGYQGRDLATIYLGLLHERWAGIKGQDTVLHSRRDMASYAQRFGVMLLDEFDKLKIEHVTDGRQVGRRLQAELLKLVEGASVLIQRGDSDKGFLFDTTGVLHIAIGAFEGLDRVIARVDGIDKPTKQELASMHMSVDSYDIQQYGFIQELVGRFASLIPFPSLDHAAIVRILEEQMLPKYVTELEAHNLGFTWDNGGLAWMAGEVIRNGRLGARAIPKMLEELVWRQGADAKPGETVAITANSVQQYQAEIQQAMVA